MLQFFRTKPVARDGRAAKALRKALSYEHDAIITGPLNQTRIEGVFDLYEVVARCSRG